MSSARIVLAAILTIALAGCSREPAREPARAPPPPAAAARETGWPAFVDEFVESRLRFDPYLSVQVGRHEFDGGMPEWSRAALEADVAELRRQLGELGSFDAATLSPDQQFERQYIAWVIDSALFWQETVEAPFRNPAWYLERLDPSMYLARENGAEAKRLEGFLGYARAVPRLTASIRENLRTPLPMPFIERGVAGFGGYAAYLQNEIPRVVARLGDEKLRAELTTATALAAKSMSELTTWFESLRASGTDAFALGAPMFLEMLRRTERLEVPLEELELVGRKELELNLAALREACVAFASRAALKVCVERMRANRPSGGSQDSARSQAVNTNKLRVFDRSHDTEERMYDAVPPEERVGLLTNALLLDVRFLSAICLHSGCMTQAESAAMFREFAFVDTGNARQQALRGTYDPGYLADTLRRLMIHKLRADWLAANPGTSPRQFLDKFDSFGSPPVPLVRQRMLGTGAGVL